MNVGIFQVKLQYLVLNVTLFLNQKPSRVVITVNVMLVGPRFRTERLPSATNPEASADAGLESQEEGELNEKLDSFINQFRQGANLTILFFFDNAYFQAYQQKSENEKKSLVGLTPRLGYQEKKIMRI